MGSVTNTNVRNASDRSVSRSVTQWMQKNIFSGKNSACSVQVPAQPPQTRRPPPASVTVLKTSLKCHFKQLFYLSEKKTNQKKYQGMNWGKKVQQPVCRSTVSAASRAEGRHLPSHWAQSSPKLNPNQPGPKKTATARLGGKKPLLETSPETASPPLRRRGTHPHPIYL